MKEALRSGNHDHVIAEAIAQERAGAQILDVNAGLPEIDERAVMCRLVDELLGVTTLPLQIDASDPAVIEAAVRRYPGKALVNSVNGKAESLAAVVPIAARYGCALVGLTLDEDGIPATAAGRLAVARKIVAATDAAGIPRADVVIDCLAMAASTDQTAPRTILDAIHMVKAELPGVRTVLGVSNISFGLPFRPLVNATFLAAAFGAGLDLAIVNPGVRRMMDVVDSWRVLSGEDEAARFYVEHYADRSDAVPASAPGEQAAPAEKDAALPADPVERARRLVLDGRGAPMADAMREVLRDHDAMFAINEVLVPALDEVGRRFEAGTFFLPQLMASAEAAKAGFETVREAAAGQAGASAGKGPVVVCTVRGDIHDIGKNIVRMLLENYGFEVIDLGRDVAPETVADVVVERHVRLVGLSALMTSTVPAMAETIELLRERAPGAGSSWAVPCSRPSTPRWWVLTSTPRTPPRPPASPARSSHREGAPAAADAPSLPSPQLEALDEDALDLARGALVQLPAVVAVGVGELNGLLARLDGVEQAHDVLAGPGVDRIVVVDVELAGADCLHDRVVHGVGVRVGDRAYGLGHDGDGCRGGVVLDGDVVDRVVKAVEHRGDDLARLDPVVLETHALHLGGELVDQGALLALERVEVGGDVGANGLLGVRARASREHEPAGEGERGAQGAGECLEGELLHGLLLCLGVPCH